MTNFFPRLAAWVDLPAFGYRVFSEESGTPPAAPAYHSLASVAQNAFGISSLKADDGTELLASPLGLVVIDDPSDTWAHGIDRFRNEIGRPTFVSSKLVEDGPVVRVTRQRLRWQQSEIGVDIHQFPQMNLVKLHFVINWREHQQILKLEIPTALASAKVSAMVPGAVEQRPTSGDEEPYQDWIALDGQIGGSTYSLGLVNNGTYSYDCLDHLLRTILIRSAPYARHNPNKVQEDSLQAWEDQGRQERIFWLTARRGNCLEQNFDRLANELQTPTEYVMDSRHKGVAPWQASFFEITPPTVSLLALKRAEDTEGAVILRVQERTGKATTMRLQSSLLGLDHAVALGPWEIKTIRLEQGKQPRTVSALEL